jgi:hypothetical protein
MVIQWLLAFLLCAPGVVQAHCRLVFDDGLLIESVLLAHTPHQQAVGLSGREAINKTRYAFCLVRFRYSSVLDAKYASAVNALFL